MSEQKTVVKKKKGKDSDQKKTLLGRPGNNVKMGIVGLPNVGKSTLFNTLSELQVPAENFPFCTIDPAVTRVIVPDERMDFICSVVHPKSICPAVLTVTDIAGLVKGAHEGKGLGNAFLSNIDACDGIFHVVRAFKGKRIEHVEGDVDPVRDLEIISTELCKKDLIAAKKHLEVYAKTMSRGLDKAKKKEFDCLTKAVDMLENNLDIREGDWRGEEVYILNEIGFLTAKPVVYLVNVGEKDIMRGGNKWFVKIKEYCALRSPSCPVVPFSAEVETKLHQLKGEELDTAIKSGMKSMIPKIVLEGYHALNLIHYFTAGVQEVRAWTVKKGSTAPQAAGVIHGDFQTHFIKAEVMKFVDYQECGDEEQTKAAGKQRTEGKNYIVESGDIMFFKHNAGSAAKKK